jgi:hypothetical protein
MMKLYWQKRGREVVSIHDPARHEVEANNQQDRTAHLARCQILEDKICQYNTGPFMVIQTAVNDKSHVIIEKVREHLMKRIDALFEKIQADFDRTCTTREDDTDEGKKFRQELHKRVDNTKHILKTDMKKYIEDSSICKG